MALMKHKVTLTKHKLTITKHKLTIDITKHKLAITKHKLAIKKQKLAKPSQGLSDPPSTTRMTILTSSYVTLACIVHVYYLWSLYNLQIVLIQSKSSPDILYI